MVVVQATAHRSTQAFDGVCKERGDKVSPDRGDVRAYVHGCERVPLLHGRGAVCATHVVVGVVNMIMVIDYSSLLYTLNRSPSGI